MFLAASSLIVATGAVQSAYAQDGGGLTEWTTDQGVEDKSTPDADASARGQGRTRGCLCADWRR